MAAHVEAQRRTVVSIVTGPLGVGKTTAINALLARRGDGDWALLVNEMGDVGIDGAVLANEGVVIKEVSGGCMCCANGVPARVALTALLRRKPQRVLIEPSGLGHLSTLTSMLTSPPLASAVDLRAVVCLVPAHAHAHLVAASEAYREMLAVADVVAVTHGDRCEKPTLARVDADLHDLYPPKQRVVRCGAAASSDGTTLKFGVFDPDLLDLPHSEPPDFPAARDGAEATASRRIAFSRADGSKRVDAVRNGAAMVAWIFPSVAAFDTDRLRATLQAATGGRVARLKGVFRTTLGPLLAQYGAHGSLEVAPIAHAADSRLQVIFDSAEPDHDLTERLQASLENAAQRT